MIFVLQLFRSSSNNIQLNGPLGACDLQDKVSYSKIQHRVLMARNNPIYLSFLTPIDVDAEENNKENGSAVGKLNDVIHLDGAGDFVSNSLCPCCHCWFHLSRQQSTRSQQSKQVCSGCLWKSRRMITTHDWRQRSRKQQFWWQMEIHRWLTSWLQASMLSASLTPIERLQKAQFIVLWKIDWQGRLLQKKVQHQRFQRFYWRLWLKWTRSEMANWEGRKSNGEWARLLLGRFMMEHSRLTIPPDNGNMEIA